MINAGGEAGVGEVLFVGAVVGVGVAEGTAGIVSRVGDEDLPATVTVFVSPAKSISGVMQQVMPDTTRK
jgi:hypothetical protein